MFVMQVDAVLLLDEVVQCALKCGDDEALLVNQVLLCSDACGVGVGDYEGVHISTP